MPRFLSRSMTPSMAVALLALIIATTGTSVAAYQQLAKNSVGTQQLKNGAVTYSKLSVDRRAAQPVLKPGQIMRGVWTAAGGTTNGDFIGEGVTFPATLPTSFVSTQFEYLAFGDPFTTNCPGPGKAARGWACFYEFQSYAASICCVYSNFAGDTGIGRTGVRLYWTVSSADGYTDGLWAIRAP